MKGGAMSLTAAASRFVIVLLTAPVLHGQNGWGVTYTSTPICALKGSTVQIGCTYFHPSTTNRYYIRVKEKFWYIKESNQVYVNLTTDPEYSGRVQYLFSKNNCTLRITDLRESDSAEYKFRFITNHPAGKYSGSPGVTLSVTVTDPQLQVHVRTVNQYLELTCHNKCQLPDHPSYIWYKNGHEVERKKYFYPRPINPTDSYRCAVSGYESFPSPPVYAPNLPSVSVNPSADFMEGSSVTLTCSSDANPAANYRWYKNNSTLPDKGPQLDLWSIRSSASGEYHCAAQNELGMRKSEYISVDVKYAPKLPSVSWSPAGEIVEGTSVTLTCHSDANPAAKYTWYKESQKLLQGPEGSYYFTSIGSKNRGNYSCMSENQHGHNSSSLFLDVRYAPKLPSVSASPSLSEIMEGSSVTLTCSSDANPAANYTWYKENEKLLQGPEGSYNFTSIRSNNSGFYYCKSENQYGQIKSSSLFIDVQYAPKLPSVSVSPSGEIVEGSSVYLTCSSDANPTAIFHWYKENEKTAKASGQTFTITNIRAEHSGNYYCEAQNRRGRHNNTLHLTVVAGVWKPAVIGVTPAVFLAIIWLFVFLLLRKKRASEQSSEPGGAPDSREQCQTREEDDLHYASVHFSKNQTDPVYSNIRPAGVRRHEEEEEVTEYTVVKFNSASAAPRTRGSDTEEEPTVLYSTVNKLKC